MSLTKGLIYPFPYMWNSSTWTTMVVDLFAHIILKPALKAFRETSLTQAERIARLATDPLQDYFFDPKARIHVLDRFGIDVQVVNLPQIVSGYLKPRDEVKVYRASNDALADLVEKHSDRFRAVANIPMSSPDEACDELSRCIADLGLKGVQIYSNVKGKPLDSKEFMPIYRMLEKFDLPMLLHPTDGVYHRWVDEYRLKGTLGWPFDTSLAMARLVFGGVFEKYPRLKVVVHHLGAMIPYFAQRIRGFYDDQPQVRESHPPPKLKKPVLEYFKMFYNDTAVYGWKPALMCAYAFCGPEHIVFATDYPFGPEKGERWVEEGLRSVREMDVPEDEKTLILDGNARRLFNER